jgi:hypothetical protein
MTWKTALAKAYDEFGIVSPRDRQRIIVQQASRIEKKCRPWEPRPTPVW